MQLPDVAWDTLDKRAREHALCVLTLVYTLPGKGGIVSETEALYRYQADLAGLDWESAPRPRTSKRNNLLKAGALAGALPLMFVSPRLTTSVLDRIDQRLTNDEIADLRPVTDEKKVIERVTEAQERMMSAIDRSVHGVAR